MPALPPPLPPRVIITSLAVAGGMSLFVWHLPVVYPFRLLVTLFHESGHAIAAWLMGGQVVSVTISPGEGGLTQYLLSPSTLRRMFVASSGYLGSALAGAILLAAAGRMRSGQAILFGIVAWMWGVALLWVPLFPPPVQGGAALASGYSRGDGLFTLLFIVLLSVGLGLVAWKGPLWLRRVTVLWIAALSCLASLEDIKGLLGFGFQRSGSDADAMAQLTGIPAFLWALLWLVMSVAAMSIGLRAALGPGRRRAPARSARLFPG